MNTGPGDDRGSAVAEFVMVSALVVILFLGLIQLATFLHAKNMAQDAAVNGARYAALADATADDGVARARALATSALGAGAVASVGSEERGSEAGTLVEVRIEIRVPLLGLIPGPSSYTATATATRFS